MRTLDMLPGALLSAELQPGEQLRWVGCPDPGALARSRQGSFWGCLLLLAFCVVWEIGVWFGEIAYPKPILLLWGAAFILYCAAAVFYAPVSFWFARRMVYAITDRRLLILHDFSRRRVESFWPADINALAVTERIDGRGDIIFRRRVVKDEEGSETIRCGFFGIGAVRDVARLVDDLRASAGRTEIAKVAAIPSINLPGGVAALLAPGEAVVWLGWQGRVGGVGGWFLKLAMGFLLAATILGARGANWTDSQLLSSPLSLLRWLIAGAIGCYLLSDLVGRLRAARSPYMLTESRLIVLSRWPFAPRSFSLANISEIDRENRPDGTGDIRFQHLVKRVQDDEAEYEAGGLFGIANAREVEALLARRVEIRPLALKRVL